MGMTPKKRHFAMLVALTGNKTESHAEVYVGKGKAKRSTHQVNGCKLSKDPAVAEAIISYQQQLLPPLKGMQEERMLALQNIKFLALMSPDDRVRLLSSRAWFEFTDEILAQLPDTTDVERERAEGRAALVSDLQNLYRRALRENNSPALALEAVVDDAPEVAPGEQFSECTEMPGGSVEAEAAEDPGQGAAFPDPDSAPTGEWRYEPIPGRNPPCRRKIWVPFK
jgi:hypothetical protein